MKCDKCNGNGYISNPKYYKHSPSWSWEHNIPSQVKCKKCNGTGYIIGNIQDIADRLRAAANGVTITRKEAKEMYAAINGKEEEK